ncbi:homocysteine S-methyltransferase [Myriangium duriaei CBS 260.36]|uniref:Homocysteine S-methyltransferase n=1 Tax=Myriangium duriaei CBS 260.36 TaxID=1168546 RepID=A0A9P4J110_9PEZI|nr:homocysteine S-methyltransferase [Myriangium duriaei CBS 260.36]
MASSDLFNALLRSNNNANTLVLDGGLATALESRGHNLNHKLWSAKVLREDPEAIRHVHRDYYLAGADVAITVSYQASVRALQEYVGSDITQAKQLIHDSARLALQARDEVASGELGRKMFVAGSVGPYGAYLANGAEYTGDYGSITMRELKDFHRERISTLLDAGVDVLACETFPNALETRALCSLLQDEFPKAHAWLSFTLKDAQHLSDGTSIQEVAETVNSCDQIVAVGFNCIALELATGALSHLRQFSTKPLVVYPNSGEKWDGVKKEWYGKTGALKQLPHLASEWKQAGARLVGGCCRTGFEDITMIGQACPYIQVESGFVGPHGRGMQPPS